MTAAQDEAFALWLQVWAPAYEEDSAAADVLHRIHDTYFLVNVVDNDFMQCVRPRRTATGGVQGLQWAVQGPHRVVQGRGAGLTRGA